MAHCSEIIQMIEKLHWIEILKTNTRKRSENIIFFKIWNYTDVDKMNTQSDASRSSEYLKI